MTEFDKQLIDKAEGINRWKWHYINALMEIADSEEARERLYYIQCNLRDLVEETL